MSEPGTGLVIAERDHWEILKDRAKIFSGAGAGILPKGITTPHQVAAIIQAGEEIGLKPMTALRKVSLVNGKTVVESEALLGIVTARFGADAVNILETDEKHAVVEFHREGKNDLTITWTMERAKRAGLLEKAGPWKTYPENMLRWRAISEGIHLHFADVALGVLTAEEMDMNDAPQPRGQQQQAQVTNFEEAPRPAIETTPVEDIHDATFTETQEDDAAEFAEPEAAPVATASNIGTVIPFHTKDGKIVDMVTGVLLENSEIGTSLEAYNNAAEMYIEAHPGTSLRDTLLAAYRGAGVKTKDSKKWSLDEIQAQIDWLGRNMNPAPQGQPDDEQFF